MADTEPVWGIRPQAAEQRWGAAPPSTSGRAQQEGSLIEYPASLQLVLAQARKHASVQRLAAGYEQWESSLRREAEERIAGFKPLQRFIEANGGQGEDWQLLRKVKSAQPVFGAAMKRSASEGTLTAAEQQPRAQRVQRAAPVRPPAAS